MNENGARDPIVSVIMSVYNAERYLAVAIESILIQTFRDFEFLIVDDGSTDRSPDILRSYAVRDDRIRLWNQPHRGQYRAANDVLDRSCGAFVAVMDADDVALPFRFERQVEYLSVHPECVALVAECRSSIRTATPCARIFCIKLMKRSTMRTSGAWARACVIPRL